MDTLKKNYLKNNKNEIPTEKTTRKNKKEKKKKQNQG